MTLTSRSGQPSRSAGWHAWRQDSRRQPAGLERVQHRGLHARLGRDRLRHRWIDQRLGVHRRDVVVAHELGQIGDSRRARLGLR